MLKNLRMSLMVHKNHDFCFSTNFTRRRSMSVIETSIALRPFIFRVHPDLFSTRGLDKAKINEESLKQLNEYIHKLHNNEAVKPLKLLFHFRRLPTSLETNISEMKTVHIHLQSTSLIDTIRTVLNACKLPLDYLDSIGINRNSFADDKRKQRVKYEWTSEHSDQELWKIIRKYETDIPYSRVEKEGMHTRRHTEDTINGWFKQNRKKAQDNLNKVQPIRDKILNLKAKLIEELGLVDIEWQSGWTISAYVTALKGLDKVVAARKDDLNLKGKTLIFSNELGVSVHGHIVLRQDMVSDSWIYILKSLSTFDETLRIIPRREKELSILLNGARILPPQQSLVLAVSYLEQIEKLVECIREYMKETRSRISKDVSNLEVTVECTTGPLMMTESGQIMLPTSCPAFLIVDYINANADKAISLQNEFIRSRISDETVISLCQSMLKVNTLTQDSSITRQQMAFCCKRLIKLIENGCLTEDVSSFWIRVGQFYTVTPEGEMCIPWNFEDKI